MEEPEASGSGTAPSRKMIKPKINFSNVHREFDEVRIFHPKKEQEVIGSKCKACQKTFYGKNSTNLKAHLEKFHPDSFKVIKSKWVYFVLFCI